MSRILKQLERKARQAGRRGESWQDVLADMTADLDVLGGYNARKRRQLTNKIMGAVLCGNAERLGKRDWTDDDTPLLEEDKHANTGGG